MNNDVTEPQYISKQQLDNSREMISNYNSIVDSLVRKKIFSFEMPIDNTARDIPFVPQSGAFLILVQGIDDGMPAYTAACSKVAVAAAGSISALDSQAGSGATWNTITLAITSTATNFQIAHTKAASGDFLVTVIGWA